MAYCTPEDLLAVWGEAVNKWADVDGTEDQEAIDDRLQLACNVASEEIDSIMRLSRFRIPLEDATGNVPLLINQVAIALAGVWLYELRGVEVQDKEPQHRLIFKRQWALSVLDEVKKGLRDVGLVRSLG